MDQTRQLDLAVYQAAFSAVKAGGPLPLSAEATELEALSVLRALLDFAGKLTWSNGELELRLPISTSNSELLVAHFEGVEILETNGAVHATWKGLHALDVLGAANQLESPNSSSEKLRDQYDELCRLVPEFGSTPARHAEIQVKRIHEQAVLPSKSRISDSGYDVTLINIKKQIGNTILFGTGLIIEPPWGWYFDVVPRSSIIKTGYIMANSVGVIDRAYRGELMVPLIKIDESAPSLELPFRAAQLIPRPIVHFPIVESTALGATSRGAKGFGSSG